MFLKAVTRPARPKPTPTTKVPPTKNGANAVANEAKPPINPPPVPPIPFRTFPNPPCNDCIPPVASTPLTAKSPNLVAKLLEALKILPIKPLIGLSATPNNPILMIKSCVPSSRLLNQSTQSPIISTMLTK